MSRDKSQIVRLIDVFAIGPSLVYLGYTARLPDAWKVWLVGVGIATIVYNGRNYLENEAAN